jgi:adenylate kinase family enzyme
MDKIIVIGCPGSGKTTFAQKLNNNLGLPLFHLDAISHKHDRTHITREEFDVRLGELLTPDQWIIDGNYSRTLERRIDFCDTVILFDLPTEACLDGAKMRVGKPRVDMPWTDTDLDPDLKNEIEQFKSKNLPEIYRLIQKYRDKTVIIFKSREEANSFLNEKSDD